MSRKLSSLAFSLCLLPMMQGCGGDNSPKVTSDDPQHEEMLLRMARATEQGGDLGTAEHFYLQVGSSPKASLHAHMELADFYSRHNQARAAAAALETTVKLFPDQLDAKRALANADINAGEPQKAITQLDEAIAKDAKNPLLYNSKGVALDRLGNYAEARNCYAQALALDPANAPMYQTNLAMSYIMAGSPQDAVRILLPLMSGPDASPTVRQDLALAYGLEGKSDEALKLGLKDLTPEQANENLKFYRILSQAPKKEPAVPNTGSPSASITDVFPEAPQAQPQPAVVVPASAPAKAAPAPAVTTPAKPSASIPDTALEGISPSAGDAKTVSTHSFDIPQPVLKPAADAKAAETKGHTKPMLSQPAQPVQSNTFSVMDLPAPVLKPDR